MLNKYQKDLTRIANNNILAKHINYLIFNGKCIFVATLDSYFGYLFNIVRCCLIFWVFVQSFGGLVQSVGAQYCLSGLCIVSPQASWRATQLYLLDKSMHRGNHHIFYEKNECPQTIPHEAKGGWFPPTHGCIVLRM